MQSSQQSTQADAKSAIWWVHLPGKKPFTMGGEPITQQEAMETVLCIWSTTKPRNKIKVTRSL